MDGVAAQQLSERDPGRRDGPRQDYPDDCSDCVPHGVKAPERTVPYHCAALVSHSRTALIINALLPLFLQVSKHFIGVCVFHGSMIAIFGSSTNGEVGKVNEWGCTEGQ